MPSSTTNPIGSKVNNWTILDHVGRGTQADVFMVRPNTPNTPEPQDAVLKISTRPSRSVLRTEKSIYDNLRREFPAVNFPRAYEYRIAKDCLYKPFNGQEYIVMDQLGCTLEQAFQTNKPASQRHMLGWTCSIVSQLECLHSLHFVHRDVNLRNIMTGPPGSSDAKLVFLIDFGNSAKYFDTSRFAFISSHVHDNSRKADLLCLLNVMVRFLTSLRHRERSTDFDEIWVAFGRALGYVKNLREEDAPDYQRVRNYLKGDYSPA